MNDKCDECGYHHSELDACPRTLYVCQSCGEEFGEGEQDNERCPHCHVGEGAPNGVCQE